MSKLDKNSVCEYCQNEMIASYRSKRFCSGKCRVYFGRENVKFNVQKTVTNIEKVVTEVPVDKELNKADMWKLMREGKI
jgi:wobble nucleotide-excising tRNase